MTLGYNEEAITEKRPNPRKKLEPIV